MLAVTVSLLAVTVSLAVNVSLLAVTVTFYIELLSCRYVGSM